MIGILKRDVIIEWSQTGRKLMIPENAAIEGELKDGYFYFKWRNIGEARLSEKFFSFTTNADWMPLNKIVPRSAFKPGHRVSGGEKNANAKLTIEKVKQIRNMFNGGLSQQQIAIKFNVSRATIAKIKQNKTWNYEKESETPETEKR